MTIVIGADKRHLSRLSLGQTSPLSTDMAAFASVPMVALQRPQCEQQEDFVHYVTYVVLQDIDTGDIFRYRRGKKGGEARLHDNYSIGVGGHVEKSGGADLSAGELVLRTIRQELLEEVQLAVSPEISDVLEKQIAGQLPGAFLIHDASDAVGRVHLGIAVIMPVKKEELGALEEGVLLEPEWVSSKQILSDHYACTHKLENWSVMMGLTADTNSYANFLSRLQITKKESHD